MLVVVEDLLYALHTRVVVTRVVLAGVVLLVPVQDATDERRDKGDASLSTSDSLAEAEQEGKVAVDAIVPLQFARGLDTFPGGGDLDEDALFLDSKTVVESDELLSLRFGGLLVEGELSVDFGGDAAGDDF